MVRTVPLVGLFALAFVACGPEYVDPIERVPVQSADACGEWLTESECLADAAHGCSFQPNAPGCKTTDPKCASGSCRSGDPFVRSRPAQGLWLLGQPYRFVGTVSWGIAWGSKCQVPGMPAQEAALERVFDDLVELKVTVLKIWAFQSYAAGSGSDYASFERVVAAARRAGVRLIFVLENQHEQDCTSGPPRNDSWYASGYASPYGEYALSLVDYARGLARHFRDEPTILAWEILHEGRTDDFDAMSAFTEEMSSVIRENDPNHLIVLGTDNGDSPATARSQSPSNYQRLHEHPAVDMLDAHDFAAPGTPLTDPMLELAAIASSLGKPIFAGATAVELVDSSAASFSQRAARVEAKLVAAFDAGYVGLLVYDYIPDWQDVTWSFDTRMEDPLAGPNGVLVRNAIPSP
jgi:mannan endo-1,4-beta-mannosidase